MNKLDKAIKILKNRLPVNYFIDVKQYKTIYKLMDEVARGEFFGNKKECIDWYNEYLSNPEKATYIDTKYFPKMKSKKKHRIEAYRICAIAGNPILVAYDQIKHRPISHMVCLLLHEMAHHYYGRRYGDYYNEYKCDKFSIMWTRRLIKEGILNEA